MDPVLAVVVVVLAVVALVAFRPVTDAYAADRHARARARIMRADAERTATLAEHDLVAVEEPEEEEGEEGPDVPPLLAGLAGGLGIAPQRARVLMDGVMAGDPAAIAEAERLLAALKARAPPPPGAPPP